MTETEKKALALLNEVAKEMGLEKVSSLELDMPGERALLRAIEQHEAFRQEVSDAVTGAPLNILARDCLQRFIIAKPDPLVEAIREVWEYPRNCEHLPPQRAQELRAALAARGLQIVEVDHD